jgi:hypothetical protein
MNRIKWVLFFWGMFLAQFQNASAQVDTLMYNTDSAVVRYINDSSYWSYSGFRFIDSFKNPDQKDIVYAPFQFQTPSEKIAISPEPFNPFLNETFIRKARGKFWFFGIGIFIAIYILYFRAAFGNQMKLRFQSMYKNFHFEDLLRDQRLNGFVGGIHANAIGLMIFCQGVLLLIITSEYVRLNSFFTYLLAIIVVGLISAVIYVIQFTFTKSMEMQNLWERQYQRQINVNFVMGLALMPVFLFFYYNGSNFENKWVSHTIFLILILWISVRLVIQLNGLIKDKLISFTSILYFCALEIIPYFLIIKFIDRSI